MASPRTTKAPYACTACGATSLKWLGQCPECQAWGTIEERGTQAGGARVQAALVPASRAALSIVETPLDQVTHRPTGIGELDRVFGGGIVPGAAILFSGEPGVGKSTLLLELAARIASTGARVLYASAEESVSQVRLRAERTGALEPTLFLASESDLATVLGHIDQVDPALVIVDSVQTVASDTIDSLAGQPSQVREVASALIRVAKQRDVPVVLVGHVTKDGQVAGPRLLEHLVDVVAHVEGDRQTAVRFVRTLKNRFGPTDEVGCFEMTGDGMREVADPSGLFLSERGRQVPGTCVTIALEGRRPLPVEIQALVVATAAPNPRRVTNGVESSRVAMLLAVLERRLGIKLAQSDVYVSTVGGVRLVEPAADLAIVAAIASAASNRPVKPGTIAYGEVSLAGEVRRVTQAALRAAEAVRMGFPQVVSSESENVQTALRHALEPRRTAPDQAAGDGGAGRRGATRSARGSDAAEDA
ncbi:DNA repair protein RadA [Pseudoclavibacter chungangensis]|uniref:DNA repair protein RadA n=1 Tax=Pseudoclavibacter chungangensis TaxID=587635 RepID=A0A7J5BMY1_9MICO|nr:DNA repair protein RadA [Pseudoclavibacter chungangensis]KAB1652966.1 DNA repair protein RadA [Pseudoclavibacter chungangensis]NYJ65234.1 DNA repair protein RadA/Sms [Pseudoclavibacter chungangensis]